MDRKECVTNYSWKPLKCQSTHFMEDLYLLPLIDTINCNSAKRWWGGGIGSRFTKKSEYILIRGIGSKFGKYYFFQFKMCILLCVFLKK